MDGPSVDIGAALALATGQGVDPPVAAHLVAASAEGVLWGLSDRKAESE